MRRPESGGHHPVRVTGLVHLGPQCPVETAGDTCEDQPAAHVTVTVSERIPGESYVAGKTGSPDISVGALLH